MQALAGTANHLITFQNIEKHAAQATAEFHANRQIQASFQYWKKAGNYVSQPHHLQ
jgi:hypothetical protein